MYVQTQLITNKINLRISNLTSNWNCTIFTIFHFEIYRDVYYDYPSRIILLLSHSVETCARRNKKKHR